MKSKTRNILLFITCFQLNIAHSADLNELFSGNYTVPVSDEQLMPFSTSEMEEIELNVYALSFALPSTLTGGKGFKVRFERSLENPNLFNSAFGSAYCLEKQQDQIECQVDYNRVYAQYLNNLLPETEDFLGKMNLSEKELGARLDIARSFSGDPIGILKINL